MQDDFHILLFPCSFQDVQKEVPDRNSKAASREKGPHSLVGHDLGSELEVRNGRQSRGNPERVPPLDFTLELFYT